MIERKTVSQCVSEDYCKGWNDALDAMPKWISVETPPKFTCDYLVYVWVAYHDGIAQMEMRAAIYNTVYKSWTVNCGRLEVVGEPTHWMPLPEPPEEDA